MDILKEKSLKMRASFMFGRHIEILVLKVDKYCQIVYFINTLRIKNGIKSW